MYVFRAPLPEISQILVKSSHRNDVSQKLGNVKRNILKSDAIVYENEHEVIKEFVEEKSNQMLCRH
jgi:hypothetical protein